LVIQLFWPGDWKCCF